MHCDDLEAASAARLRQRCECVPALRWVGQGVGGDYRAGRDRLHSRAQGPSEKPARRRWRPESSVKFDIDAECIDGRLSGLVRARKR